MEVDGINYFAPLEHPRPQHQNLKSNPHIIKIKDGKYGIISLNNMIPIKESLLMDFDIMTDSNKNVLVTQFIFCQKNIFKIREELLRYIKKKLSIPMLLRKRCSDFKKLEEGLLNFCKGKVS